MYLASNKVVIFYIYFIRHLMLHFSHFYPNNIFILQGLVLGMLLRPHFNCVYDTGWLSIAKAILIWKHLFRGTLLNIK